MTAVRGLHWRGRPVGRAALARILTVTLLAGGMTVTTPAAPSITHATDANAAVCGKNYVAGGDHLPAGHEVSESERYPSQLIEDHAAAYGYCVFNLAANETTSTEYINDGQLATTWNRQADLITLTVGGENSPFVKLVTDCFDKVKDHDFTEANLCAVQAMSDPGAFTQLRSDLTTTLQQYRMIMAGRPNLVVAVTGYPNPYPSAIEALGKVALLCLPLIDTIPTCLIRWIQFPLALLTLDAAFKFLNTSIQAAVKPFQLGPSGNRFVFVDTYTKLRDHCMEMKVQIKTEVEHPEQSGAVHKHDSPEVNFGCSDPWFVKGDDGTKIPQYLDPAALGVLINKSQTTKGMGVHPNADGHECIADLIWEADTIDPGTTPLKWKLGVPEAPDTNVCG